MNFLKSKDREIFVVGGQAHNYSFYDVKIDEACLAVKKMVCTLFFCGLEPGKTEPANLFRYG